jgi:hypothetical protein
MTPLHSTLKRALIIDGRNYVLTLNETALKLTLKGKRNGVELPWVQLVNGEAALAVALHASLGAFAAKARIAAAKPPRAAAPPVAAKAPRAAEASRTAQPAAAAKSRLKAKPARKK